MNKQRLICLGFSIISSLIVVLFYVLGLLEPWEMKFYDNKFIMRPEKRASEDIIIVAVDEESISKLGQFPWPRDIEARGIRNLAEAGAKVIGVDIIFPDPTRKDRILANSIRKSKCVVGSYHFNDKERPVAKTIRGKTVIENEMLTEIVFPVDVISDSFADLGFTNAYPDDDGLLRRAKLKREYKGENYYSLNAVVLSVAQNADVDSVIPKLKDDMLHVNYRNPDPDVPERTYIRYSFVHIYSGNFIKKWIKDKIVLIGSTATGAFDHYPSPFVQSNPGVEFHANIIDNLLNNDYIRFCPDYIVILFTVLLAVLLSQLFLKIKPVFSAVVFVILVIVMFYGSQLLFTKYYFHFDFLKPALNVTLSFAAIMAYRFSTEAREKRWIKKTFSTYLSPQVVNELISNPGKLSLGGERKNISILFSDIRGFTSMAEQLAPEEVVGILNEYLSAMTEVVFKYNGTLDKFIGDAIMVIWGAPIPQEDHAKQAVLCAIEMLERLAVLRSQWAQQKRPLIDIGVGINTGDAIVGNMGSSQRMEYTSIGDAVNLASRLESLNKQYKTRIIISESTYKQVRDIVECKPLGEVKVKGKEEATVIYEVLRKA